MPNNLKIPAFGQLISSYVEKAKRAEEKAASYEENARLLRGAFFAISLFFYKVFMFTQGWTWFIRPLSPDVPNLHYWYAAGLMTVVSLLQVKPPAKAVVPKSYGGYALGLALGHAFMFAFHLLA